MRDGGPPRQRPGWWPEGEPFPPTAWERSQWMGARRRRGHFARRMGCLFLVVSTVMVASGVVILWLLASLINGVAAEGPPAHLLRAASFVLLAVVFIGLVAGLSFGRRLVGPLGELVDAAGRIESGDFSVRVPRLVRGPRDLRALIAAFNTMAARLEAEEARRRRLLADLGHELRTPLAVIEGHLEAILDGIYPADAAHLDPILDETRVLERLVDDLRTVSLAEAGSLTLHREPVDLGHLVADVVAALAPRAAATGARITAQVEPGLPELDLDPVRWHQVLANLLDNALRYTPPSGTVSVGAARVRAGSGALPDAIELSVTDEGPGLSPELRETLFDRFVKSSDSPGSGLGLAIARAVVEAHGGRIRAEGAAPQGTRIVISLPMTASP